jgi:hypothetical protein
LQFATIPGWVGVGVATPLLGTVEEEVVVVVAVRVVMGVVVIRVVGVVVVWVVVVVDVVVVDVVGSGSNKASMQYECPAWSVSHFAGMDGFWFRH